MILRIIPFLTLFFSCVISLPIYAQVLKGQVTDNKNIPVPFAVVYDETSYSGTTCNADGYYELKLEPGTHSLVYKAMGYNQVRRSITFSGEITVLNIQMKEQPVQLKEVVITPGKEDPAYAIMRKVIGLAPYHLNQVKQYTADVYLRGTIHIIKIPKFISKHTSINGATNVLKSGDVFIEESQNQVRFTAPDKYEQKVLSIRSTFPWNNEKINPMGMINSSLYESETEDIISPLATNAFHFYNYRYEGFFEEGDQVVFKIKIIPRHNNQQLMSGYLYIVDRLWCLHSADIAINMFFGSIKFKIIYSPIKENVWLPISYQFHVEAGLLGVDANYKYNSSVKFREVVLNEKNAKIQAKIMKSDEANEKEPAVVIPDDKKNKNRKAIESLMAKEELSNRDMVKMATLMAKEAPGDTAKSKSLEVKDAENNKQTVEKDAVKNDTAYWNSVRPIPLTAIESKIAGVNDSMLTKTGQSSIKGDSSEISAFNKGTKKILNFMTSGAGFWMFDSTFYFKYEGLTGLKKFDFNSVDGFIFRQTFSLSQKIDSSHWLTMKPGIAYAFNRERFMWYTEISYDYAPLRQGNITFHIESGSADYNRETGINSTVNSLASLFFRRNYMKLFQQNHAYVSNRVDLANSLSLNLSIGYRTSQPLRNHSDFSFFYRDERNYSVNMPGKDPELLSEILYNEESYWDAVLEYTPQNYYRIKDGRKNYLGSKYPTFYLHNRMAVPGIVNSTADYDLLEIGLKQNKTWGMMHAFYWNAKAGFFLNRGSVYSMDYKFFNNQDVPVVFGNARESFRLVPFYRNATNNDFAELHIRFTTPYLMLKYLPFLSNKIWCENIHFNYLVTNHQQYWEAGYSISQIYMAGSIGVYAGFINTSIESTGLQISIDL